MSTHSTRPQTDARSQWEDARSRTGSELLAVLAPTDDEPSAIQRMAVWKTGPVIAPASGGAA